MLIFRRSSSAGWGPAGHAYPVTLSADHCGGFFNSRVVLELPTAGRYDIVATTYQGTSYGPYQIELSWVTDTSFAAR